jgi:molecular chaperone IbpA
MYDLLFSSVPRFSSSRSMKHEMDLLSTAMDMLGGVKDHSSPSFPKYNTYRMLDGNPYTTYLEFALAGYSKESLEVAVESGYLVVSSKTNSKDRDKEREYLHRGMARRDFSSKFYVGRDVEVRSAKFADGLLTVELEKLVPEEQKPKPVVIS